MLNIVNLVSYFSAGGVFFLFALVLVLRSGFRNQHTPTLIIATFVMSIWAVAIAIIQLTGPEALATGPLEISSSELLLIISGLEQLRLISWVIFLFVLLKSELPEGASGLQPVGFVTLSVASGVICFSLWYAAVFGWAGPDASSAIRAAFGFQLLEIVIALVLLENLFRNGSAERIWSIKHLCIGVGAIFAFDFFIYAEAVLLNRVNPMLYSARGFIDILAIPLILVSVSRSRTWLIDIHVSREVVFHSASMITAGVYLVAMSMTGYYLKQIEGVWSGVLQIVFLAGVFLVFTVLFTSGSARANFRFWIAKNFFSYRYDYREIWLQVTDSISAPGQAGLHERIVRGISELVECTSGALWVYEPADRVFLPTARLNFGDVERTLPALSEDEGFIRFLRETGWVLDLENLDQEIEGEDYGLPPEWLVSHRKARYVVPFFHGESLIGILVIGSSRVNQDLDWEARDLLKTSGRQAAGYLVEEQSTNALSDARRLQDFSKRSAFIVHDIKNSIGQLDLMLKNAEKYKHRPDFQEDMLATVTNTVQQMNKLLLVFKAGKDGSFKDQDSNTGGSVAKDGARGQETAEEGTFKDVGAIVKQTVRQWLPKKGDLEIEIGDYDAVSVDPEKLGSVLNHLIQNSIDAAGRDGRIVLRLAKKDNATVVEVEDDGPGMDAKFVEEELFKPLRSGKKEGFGIGAYQTRELVREMGARLEVITGPGKGTIMRIVFQPQ